MSLGADQINVSFYRRGEEPAPAAAAPVVILSVASEDWANAQERAPAAEYKERTRPDQPAHEARVARLFAWELLHEDDCGSLPGLDHMSGGVLHPSLVRDAARLALQNTDTPIEVALIVAGNDLHPWDLPPEPAREEFSYLLSRYLQQRTGAVVVLPDAAGPPPVSSEDAVSHRKKAPRAEDYPERWGRLGASMKRLEPLFREFRLIGLCDAPLGIDDVLSSDHLLAPLAGIDCGVCTWSGRLDDLRRHSWRSAAAIVGAALARSIADLSTEAELAVPVLSRHDVVLGAGRTTHPPRLTWSDERTEIPRIPETTDSVLVHLGGPGQPTRIVHDASLRRPLGDWPLPALWMAKQVIRRIEEVASAYVFATADAAMAIDLETALLEELEDLIGLGVLIGPTDDGTPMVEASVAAAGGVPGQPISPRLEANISAALAPWLTRLDVMVEVDQTVQVRTL